MKSCLLYIAFFSVFLSAQNTYVPYQLGPGDVVKISVTNLAEINSEFRIDMSGNLTVPLLGSFSVMDKTVLQVQEELRTRLAKDLLNNPDIQIELRQINFRPISVIGAVKKPGRLETVNLNLNLVDTISQAGGLSDNAGSRALILRKTGKGQTATLEVDLDRLLNQGVTHLNLPIFPGDTINIPVRKPLIISMFGEVARPGEINFQLDHGRVTVLRAIAAAGGFTDFAKQDKVVVKRQVRGVAKEFVLDVRAISLSKQPDFELQENDVVVVH